MRKDQEHLTLTLPCKQGRELQRNDTIHARLDQPQPSPACRGGEPHHPLSGFPCNRRPLLLFLRAGGGRRPKEVLQVRRLSAPADRSRAPHPDPTEPHHPSLLIGFSRIGRDQDGDQLAPACAVSPGGSEIPRRRGARDRFCSLPCFAGEGWGGVRSWLRSSPQPPQPSEGLFFTAITAALYERPSAFAPARDLTEATRLEVGAAKARITSQTTLCCAAGSVR